jgi:hypothetical protein
VSGAISTLGGSGRRANSWDMAGFGLGRVTGVGTLEVARGVTALDDRGLFLNLGLDGACRKSSGMSFQLSIAFGTDVLAERTRGGAEVDFGGGGGRFAVDGATGGDFRGCSFCLAASGFFSQPVKEDCIVIFCE